MIASSLFTLVLAVTSLAGVNGGIVQRDGSFSYVSPQPTLQGSKPPTSSPPVSTPPVSSPPASVPPVSPPPTTSPTTTSSITPPTTSPTSSSPVTAPPPPPTTTQTPPPPGSSVTPTTTATPPSGTANCNGVQQWQSAFAYTAGNKVIFNNQLYTALQWTYNNAPPSHPDQWSANGVCAQPINNKVSCTGVAAWQSNVAYTSGNQVVYNGHLWSAVQWTQANAPGGTSGTWQDLGACM